MAGSTYGNIFKITTWGESHGPALGVVIDGCPAGLSLNEEDIQKYLDRRKPGQDTTTTARKEQTYIIKHQNKPIICDSEKTHKQFLFLCLMNF